MSQTMLEKEIRKALRDKAKGRRQGVTEFEMRERMKKKYFRIRSEKDLHLKLPDGEEPRVVTAGGYQVFRYNPLRLYSMTHLRDFFFPGFAARLFEKRCMTVVELNIALGLPHGKLKQWVLAKEFPPPLGLAYTAFKGEPVPCYTIREAGTYAQLLTDHLGITKTVDYWTIHKPEIVPVLFEAYEQTKRLVFEQGDKTWRFKDEL